MQRLLFIALISLFFTCDVIAQGLVRGKITDNLGEALIGVTVVLKSNPSVGAATDLDGNYSVKISEATPVVLVVSYVGFKTIEETVNPKNGEVVVLNIKMESSAVEFKKEAEITATKVKAANYYMEDMKKKSATTIDYVSSETMRKTGDNNVTSAISRVTGVSNTAAGFITVRGIGDRYVKTTINGSVIPTLDPFTNNIKLDFIPANLIDNVIITKTASPELPGSWAGAYISVETKDYPEQLTVAAETQIGYNTQSTFQKVLGGERSSTDWLGYDNDLRDRDNTVYSNYYANPTQYQEMVALGLKDYYASLGITEAWDPNTPLGQDLFNLGLIELGLLEPALINDANAVSAATQEYQETLALDAFSTINAPAAAQNKKFANTWEIASRTAPINFSQSFGVGNQYNFGKSSALGYLFGLRYGMSTSHDGDAELNRPRIDQDGIIAPNSFYSKQVLTRELNTWSALAKLAYKINGNNSIGFTFMPNFNGTNSLRTINGVGIFEDQPDAVYFSQDQFYEERRQMVYQMQSDHYLPKLKTRIHLDASYTDGYSNIPDFRTLGTFTFANGSVLSGLGDLPNTRDFRYLNEDMIDSRISFEFPLGEKPGKVRKIKVGAAYSYLDRDFNQYQYILAGTDSSGNVLSGSYAIPDGDLTAFLDPSNFEITSYVFQGGPNKRAELFYLQTDVPGNRTIGFSEVMASYAMFDYSLNFKWRLAGGLRVEMADIFGDIFAYDSAGYAKNDIRRKATGDDFLANPGKINTTKFLPSISLIYKYRDDEKAAMNLRANYSRTTAYPSIREITENNVYDFELRNLVFGNSNLKPVDIDNFDLRWEGYFKKGNSISVSAFYKYFKNHIELLNFENANTWTNVDKSFVAGVELEGVKKLTKNLEFRANLAIIESETFVVIKELRDEDANGVKDGIYELVPADTLTRNMFGQAPYLVNAILSYNFEKLKGNVTVSYNIQGKRLVIAATRYIPDVYEMSRNVLDVKFSKNLGKHFVTSLTVRDILNQPIRRKYDLVNGQNFDFDSYRWGTSINLGITYRL